MVAVSAAVAVEPEARIRSVSPASFPGVHYKPVEDKRTDGEVDCNSPAHWDGDTLYVFNSAAHPYRSHGAAVGRLSRPADRVTFDNDKEWNERRQGARWIEATHVADGGRLYMWYHNELPEICGIRGVTAPRIGQMVSTDNGLNWHDQGLMIEAPPDALNCESANYYFKGGNGDFSVAVDRERKYVYFFISTYHRDVAEQGVSVARLDYGALAEPRGRVFKWHRGSWGEPGLGGHVTPIFPVLEDWHAPDADAFWGPSIHWNTHLEQWVILLNRAKDKNWAQEGVYVSYNRDLADPAGWSKPRKLLDGSELPRSKWYPQVIGSDASRKETDKLAGRRARLFVAGLSLWELEFRRPGETQPAGE